MECQTSESGPQSKPRVKRWTHRTRTGCMICRKRRIKCDEQRPYCKRCLIAGHDCPGYVGDKALFLGKQKDLALVPQAKTSPQPDEMHDSLDLLSLIPLLLQKQRDNGVFLNESLLYAAARYAQHLPSLSSHHEPLDAAVCCLAEGIRELLRTSRSQTSGASLLVDSNPRLTRRYLNAVASLRVALDDCKPSTWGKLPLAAILICCYESMKDRSEETAKWHMYGLSKIFEHRGVPNLDSEVEYKMMLGSLPLMVMSSYYSNLPTFLSQKNWLNSIQTLQDMAPIEAQALFIHSWRSAAMGTTLLAECSQFIVTVPATTLDWDDKRRKLLAQVKRLEQICIQDREQRLKELTDEPGADIYAVFEQLSSAKGGLKDYRLHLLALYPRDQLLYCVLRIALGGAGALAASERAKELTDWFDAFGKRYTRAQFEYSPIFKQSLEGYLETANVWQFFAREAETGAANGRPRVVDAKFFKRWMRLAGIKPRE